MNGYSISDFTTWSAAHAWFDLYFPHYGDAARLDAARRQDPLRVPAGPPLATAVPGAPGSVRGVVRVALITDTV
jgi:hypothetical protein